MKLSHTLLICACLVFAGMNFSNAVTPAPAPQQQVQKWEYKMVQIGDFGAKTEFFKVIDADGVKEPIQKLRLDWINTLGDQGWDLVSFTHDLDEGANFGSRGEGDNRIYYFKRPKN